MLRKFKSIHTFIGDILTDVQGYGFLKKKGHIEIRPGYVNISSNHLLETTATWVSNHAILRTGQIDTLAKTSELELVIKTVHEETQKRGLNTLVPLRVSVIQVNVPDTEWDQVRQLHYLLAKHGLHCAHFNLPTEPFFRHKNEESRSLLLQKTNNKLSRHLNTEGWLLYSDWLNQELEALFRTLQFDATEEYQLEASIKDFSHEMSSFLLQRDRHQMRKMILELGDHEFAKDPATSPLNYQEVLEFEKNLLKRRLDIQANLKHQHEVLEEAVAKIIKIERAHPELNPIKNISLLLKASLAVQTDFSGTPLISWGQQVMLLGLLDWHLGVISVINGTHGLNRTNIAFAVKLAIVQLIQHNPGQQVIDLALQWDETVPQINRKIAELGAKGFGEWLKDHSDQTLLHQRAELTEQLRHFVWENLRQLCVLIGKASMSFQEGLIASSDYLQFLPAFDSEMEGFKEIVEYDKETGLPTELRPYGQRLIVGFFSNESIT